LTGRIVTLQLDGPFTGEEALEIEIDPSDPRTLRTRIRDVAAELPALLEHIRRAGRTVNDVEVRGPSLQAVFIHLTGRELRE
jgi:hypothetical protein